MPEQDNETEITAEERAAMKDLAAERRRAKGMKADEKKAADAAACAEKIAEMPPAERALAEKVHEIVTTAAPHIEVKTWYGMPAYALDGKVVCFFKPAEKFKSRYCTLGFEDRANVDEGTFWPTSYAVTGIGPAEAKQIAELVARAVQ